MVGQRKRRDTEKLLLKEITHPAQNLFSIKHKHGQIINLAFSQSEYIGSTTSQTS